MTRRPPFKQAAEAGSAAAPESGAFSPTLGAPQAPVSSPEIMTPGPDAQPVEVIADPSDEAPQTPAPDPRIAENEAKLAKMGEQLEKQRKAARDNALDSLGVLPKYRALAPDVDPFTDDGKAALERFAADHPEILRARPNRVPEFDAAKWSKAQSPHLVSVDKIRESKAILRRQRMS